MNYIEDALRRQAAMFAALLGGGQWREKNEERQAGNNGKAEWESGGDGALRGLSRTEEPEERQGFPREMAAWNRLLARRGEGQVFQAAGTREQTDEELHTVERMSAESPLVRSRRAETVRLNAERTAVQGRNSAGTGAGLGEVEMSIPGELHFKSGGTNAGTTGTVLVVDGGVSAGELSRTFQRDARRYDGGYPLY
ncbi:hypothetical protein [Oscillibacter sp. GMB15532]|uniref:hypothetical protein n=1 Tax=Oscillibacter sp. GMB15532 TaxID=3230022 RepID=UPI0034DF7359